MKMGWSPEGGLQFRVFRKKGQKLNYVGIGSTHTPSTLRAITLGFLNHTVKLTSRKPSFHSKRNDSVYPDHLNALRNVGLEPTFFLTMGKFWKGQDE